MENDTTATNNGTAKVGSGGGGVKSNNHINEEEEHSNLNSVENLPEKIEENDEHEAEQQQTGSETTTQQPSRTPFTNLSQVDADLALARTLQEQVPLSCVYSLIHFYFSCLVE